MAFPATIDALPAGTNGVTVLDEAFHNPTRAIVELIEEILVGPLWVNVLKHGADPTGAADSAQAFEDAITELGNAGGTVYAPPGRYRFDSVVLVPSRIRIQGSGQFATRFFGASTHTGFIFETTKTFGETNQYDQNFGVVFRDFTIEDRASTDVTKLTGSGRSEGHSGILVHDSDWGAIENVMLRDLDGRGLYFSNVAREWFCRNVYTHNCANATVPALDIGATSGDATNTLYFYACRFIFSAGRAVNCEGAIDGIRLIVFTDCQFEGGGNGSGGSYGNPHDYDLIHLGLMQTIAFKGCNFSNPGAGEFCIDVDGSATSNVNRVDIAQCKFNANAQGGCVRANRVDEIIVQQTLFEGSTASEADFYVETVAGIIQVSLDTTYSANPTAGSPAGHIRGRTGVNKVDWRDNMIDLSGGGIVPAYSSGQPSENLNMGFASVDGMLAYDTANKIMWMKRNGIWVPMAGQVIFQDGEAGFFGSAAENDMINTTIPANVLHSTGGIEVLIAGYFAVPTGSNAVRLRIYLGGTLYYSAPTVAMALDTDPRPWIIRLEIRNVGATNVQRAQGTVFIASGATADVAGRGAINTDEIESTSVIGFSADKDMTTAQTLRVTWQFANSRDNVRHFSRIMVVS